MYLTKTDLSFFCDLLGISHHISFYPLFLTGDVTIVVVSGCYFFLFFVFFLLTMPEATSHLSAFLLNKAYALFLRTGGVFSPRLWVRKNFLLVGVFFFFFFFLYVVLGFFFWFVYW